MPAQTTIPGLSGLADLVRSDPGLTANIYPQDIEGGAVAAELMNSVFASAIEATGVNADGVLTPADLMILSDYIRANPALYEDFVIGHGDDEGMVETGFHLVQGDGGAFLFQGRAFIDTIADAIYHIGFEYADGRFVNEDGDANERVDDVAGWLNYFVNGRNILFGTGAGDTLHSGNYSIALTDAANEVFYGYGGNDEIWAGDGADTVHGGNGDDRSGGGDGADAMFGNKGNDSLYGEAGDDTLSGGGGDDVMTGGTGSDRLIGNNGDDRLFGEEDADMLRGGGGNDVMGGGTGDDTLQGGSGHDTMWGDAGDDRLVGFEGEDYAAGGDGDDEIRGGEGSDTLAGNDGNDTIEGGARSDTIWGGAGEDFLSGGYGADQISGNTGDDAILGGSGADRIWGDEGADTINGNAGADILSGGSDDDVIRGDAGNDTLNGDDGEDSLFGGDGNDVLRGGNGVDLYVGGVGVDVMQDWEEVDTRDVFVFAQGDTGVGDGNRDVIEGFDSGIDRIDLSAFGGLDFVGGSSFGAGGRAAVLFDGGVLQIDSDGDGAADAEIALRWVQSISVEDLVL